MTSQVSPDRLDMGRTRRRVEDALRKNVTPEQLIKVAESLGVEAVELPGPVVSCHHHHCCDYEHDLTRPNFGPNQVRSHCQLVPGLMYQSVHGREGRGDRFRLLSQPYHKHDFPEGWWVDVEYESSHYRSHLSLQDHSVDPYRRNHGTFWNTSNWIAFTDESRPTCCCCHSHSHNGSCR
jgi:hypothetical protein